MPLVFDELRRMARRYLDGEDPGTRCSPPPSSTSSTCVWWTGARYLAEPDALFGFAAQLMRRILVEHARARQTDKRDRGGQPLSIEALIDLPERRDLKILRVDEALPRWRATTSGRRGSSK